jgi:hypothetical protein
VSPAGPCEGLISTEQGHENFYFIWYTSGSHTMAKKVEGSPDDHVTSQD